jgi:hypothetical protein
MQNGSAGARDIEKWTFANNNIKQYCNCHFKWGSINETYSAMQYKYHFCFQLTAAGQGAGSWWAGVRDVKRSRSCS